MPLQTMSVSCRGGLNLSSSSQELLQRPGEAIELINFECDVNGGYRRIAGYAPITAPEAPVPGAGPIKGIFGLPDDFGLIVARGDYIYHTVDFLSWVSINRPGADDDTAATLVNTPEVIRELSTRYTFEVYKNIDAVEVHMTDGFNNPLFLSLRLDAGLLRYTIRDIVLDTALKGATVSEMYKKQYYLAGLPNDPGSFYYSSLVNSDVRGDGSDDINGTTRGPREKFNGATSGYINVGERIVGLKSFREILYIFCNTSIWRAVGMDVGQPQVEPVTRQIGCVDGHTIQEIGTNLVFLAPDGLRTVAGTDKIGDVELGVISRKIQPLLDPLIDAQNQNHQFSSCVIKRKNQYRLFHTIEGDTGPLADVGITASLIQDPQGNTGWNFSELRGFNVAEIAAGTQDNDEKVLHGSFDGVLYRDETGSTFDGEAIPYFYHSPYSDMGDIGTRKNVHEVAILTRSEGPNEPVLEIRYDYQNLETSQPLPYTLSEQGATAQYGQFTYGDTDILYGQRGTPAGSQYTEGSGHTVAIRIRNLEDSGINTVSINAGLTPDSPFIIDSFNLDVIANGRI